MTHPIRPKSPSLKRNGAKVLWRGLAAAAVAAAIGLVFLSARPSAQGAPAVASVEISPKAYSLNPCETRQFSVTVKDAAGEDIKEVAIHWQSTNPDVARVNGQGVATGLSAGYTFIRAVAGGVKSNASSLFIRDKGVPRNC